MKGLEADERRIESHHTHSWHSKAACPKRFVANRTVNGSCMARMVFTEWLVDAVTRDSPFEAIHVDELDLPIPIGPCGPALVRGCCELLELGRTTLGTAPGHRVRSLIVFLPLTPTEHLTFWTDGLWDVASLANEPPTFYVMCREQILEEWDEEYRRPVDMPLPEYAAVNALYRCWRTRTDMEHSWEFARGVYLVLELRRP